MTIGVRILGESNIRWIASSDSRFRAGDRVSIDGVPASIVIAADQMTGMLPIDSIVDATIEHVLPATSNGRSDEAEILDIQLSKFPQPGSNWESEIATGTVTSINLKHQSFTVRDNFTGESVTVPLTQESE